MKTLSRVCACLGASLLLGASLSAERPDKLEALSWMAGHWVGTATTDLSEELWLPPAAGSMVGVWRWANDGKLRLYELLTVSQEADNVVLRLRHFQPNLHALEEKDAPFVLPVVSGANREVVFEGKGTEGLLRIGYRSPTADTLEAFVEKGGKRQTFSYRRVQPQARQVPQF